jgi:DNA invertase Pin-like site-specific DNA recombinase
MHSWLSLERLRLSTCSLSSGFAKASGKNTNRPQLKAALDYLRDGDVLVVHSMDRLARNITDLL